MGVLNAALATYWAQRGHLFNWVPVCLGVGIGLYFTLGIEPPILALIGCGGVGLACLIGARFLGAGWAPVPIAIGVIAMGVTLAGVRAHMVAGPVLEFRYYGPVQGRVVGMDRSGSDALRLTLDQVVLRNMAPRKTPDRVRISLHSQWTGSDPVPGLTVMTTAHLGPPGGPVEPGGFDFQRHAWFAGLGAVGYTRVPVLALSAPDGMQPLFGARMALSQHVQSRLPGEQGAFAAAIMTGDRAGMGQDTLRALRASNLAHLIAISGLHMGLLAGVVFAAARLGLAALPFVSLRVPTKKISALFALLAAAGYLGLSGGNVATERAFVMVAVVLIAVMFDRRAISIRAVAVAAIIVLCLRPEALLGPGFQMSFAATTALVAVFGWIKQRKVENAPAKGLAKRWMQGAGMVAVSSLVAGLATAPFAAAHFNQIAHYGLIANLLSVPLMGVLVMPAAVFAVCLMPFGLEGIGLWVMGIGLRWILGVAHYVSALEGARGTVPSPDISVLPLLAIGALFVILWQGRVRVIGAVPVFAAFVIWSQVERPDVLISGNGTLVGVMTPQGRALSKAKGAGFVASNWLENDGDSADQAQAAALWDRRDHGILSITALSGKRAARAFTTCAPQEWVVSSVAFEIPDLPCTVLSPETLRETGAMALYFREAGVKTVTARQISGARLWNSRQVRRRLWP